MKAWYCEASQADWQSPADIKTARRNASIIAHNRVLFNIKGNTYRLIVAIRYDIGIIFIRFIGTHAEYDKVDAETI
ncbi:type II toxin-antitoxin system HigB family toxin [Microcoleus sp. ARI1-B5]|uniref:type II toxin-antitoxin system HigB family toxin n=1 Tax=unclassified Microcoleus TaxID=2642155 RepID=UPI002FD0BB20